MNNNNNYNTLPIILQCHVLIFYGVQPVLYECIVIEIIPICELGDGSLVGLVWDKLCFAGLLDGGRVGTLGVHLNQ